MKSILTSCLLFAFLYQTNAWAGIRDVGNGGDAVVLEFKKIANQVLADLKKVNSKFFDEFSVDELSDAIEQTTVISIDKTILNGVEKDAINYPSKKVIHVSRSRWGQQSVVSLESKQLVLHEYLGIMKLDDSDYQISNKLEYFYQSIQAGITNSLVDDNKKILKSKKWQIDIPAKDHQAPFTITYDFSLEGFVLITNTCFFNKINKGSQVTAQVKRPVKITFNQIHFLESNSSKVNDTKGPLWCGVGGTAHDESYSIISENSINIQGDVFTPAP